MEQASKSMLLVIWMCSLAIRVLVFWGYLQEDEHYWQVDSGTYHRVALSIAAGKGIVNPDGSNHFYRVPGYSFFLSIYYRLFGIDTKNVLWVQILIASLIPLLIFFLALLLLPGHYFIAYMAAWLSVFHIGFVLYSGFFMTESIFVFFFLLFLLYFFRVVHFLPSAQTPHNVCLEHHHSSGWRPLFYPEPLAEGLAVARYYDGMRDELSLQGAPPALGCQEEEAVTDSFIAGMFLGATALLRPVGHYLLVLALLLIVLSSYDVWSKVRRSTTLFLGWFLLAGWWLIRNYLLLGALFFHTLPGGHFLYLSAARVAMRIHDCSYEKARTIVHQKALKRMEDATQEKGSALTPIEECSVNEALAREYFKARPLVALGLWCTDIFRALFSLYSAEIVYLERGRASVNYFDKDHGFYRMIMRYLCPDVESWWVKFLVYTEIIFFLGLWIGVIGAFMTALYQWILLRQCLLAEMCLKTLPFMMIFIVIALAGGYARMRLPIAPLLLIWTSYWWSRPVVN